MNLRARLIGCFASLALVGFLTAHAQATLTMEVFPSPAPNIAASAPAWPGYLANALNSLENGLGDIGDPDTDPTAYRVIHTAPFGGEFIVTGVNSWLGQLNPGTVFGPAFAGEFGNRLHFGLHILGNGTQFRLQDLTFNMSSTDPFNFIGFTGNFIGSTYAAHRVGIDYVDGIKGNGNDVIYNAGQSAANVIDELVYAGVGLATVGNVGWGGGTPEENMALALEYIQSNRPWDIIGRYTQYASDGITVLGSTYNVVSVPEPASALLVALGLGAWLSRRHPAS